MKTPITNDDLEKARNDFLATAPGCFKADPDAADNERLGL
jgi:hypothetical protein